MIPIGSNWNMAHILALKVTFNIDMKYSVHVWKIGSFAPEQKIIEKV